MSNAQVAAPEPKTAAEWQQKIEEYEITLAGPTLEPAIKNAIEALRADAIKRKFLAEITAPTVNVACARAAIRDAQGSRHDARRGRRKFKNVRMGRSLRLRVFLKNNPPHLLFKERNHCSRREKSESRRSLDDFQNPTPIPFLRPPPPIALPPEVVALVEKIVRAEVPSIIAQTIAWFRANPEWMQSN